MAERKRKGIRRVDPTLIFLLVVAAGLVAVFMATRDRVAPPSDVAKATYTEAQLAPLTDDERAIVLWMAEIRPELSAIGVAGMDLAEAASTRDLINVERACRQISDRVAIMRDRLPAPDPELDRHLRTALEGYDAGGRACRAGVAGDAAEIRVATDAFEAADIAMLDAAALVPVVE